MERTVWSDERLDDAIAHIEQRFDRIDARLDRIDERLDALHRTLVQGALGVAGALFVQLIVFVLAR
jgi:hypothetical protein